MREILIQNAHLVNEGELCQKDLLIRGEKIAKILNEKQLFELSQKMKKEWKEEEERE